MSVFQLPMLAMLADNEGLRERVAARSQLGTDFPDSVLSDDNSSYIWESGYWMPEQASSFAKDVDFMFMGITWISLVFFVGIIGTMCYFVFKYQRRGNEIKPLPSPSHHTGIEILWSVVPSILLAWMFYEGANTFFEMRRPTVVEEEILVKAQSFSWEFTYPDGDKSGELHLVLDRPTRLKMYAEDGDVLHSLYVPAFRQKMDCVPGRFTYFFVKPTKLGAFRLNCTEYCGSGHSEMKSQAVVHKDDATRKASTEWIKAEHAPWEYGQRLFQINCSGCHKVDQAATGPAFNQIWAPGEERAMADGRKVVVDYEYIKNSIYDPDRDIVAGFAGKMPSFYGKLNLEDINALVQYMKYLKDPSSVSSEVIGDNPITLGNGEGESEEGVTEETEAAEKAEEVEGTEETNRVESSN